MNVKDLFDFCKDDSRFVKLEEDDDPRVLDALTWGINWARGMARQHFDPNFYLTSYDITLDGSAWYDLPSNTGTIEHVENADSRAQITRYTLRRRAMFTGTDYPSGQDVTVWYRMRQPALMYGKLVNAASSTTTLTLPANTHANLEYGRVETLDDIYNGFSFESVSGTGDGQIMLATDYDYPDVTVTSLDGSAITAVDNTTYVSSYVDDIPMELLSLVPDYALWRLLRDKKVYDEMMTVLRLNLSDVRKKESMDRRKLRRKRDSGLYYFRDARRIQFLGGSTDDIRNWL